MPSKAQKNRGALLPETLPEGTVCVTFQCPDNELIIAALKGQLASLGKFLFWERGGGADRRATELAARWRELIEETFIIQDCLNMIDCEDVKACLDDQQDPPRRTPEKQMQDDILKYLDIENCDDSDKDKIFGFTTQLVDFFDTVINDIFELIESAFNAVELMSAILDAFPVVGDIPESGFQLANFIQETIAELYNGHVTVGLKTEVACDLFCIAIQRDCTLTLNDIAIYFGDQLQHEIVGAGINDYIDYFLDLSTELPGKTIVLACMALIAHSLAWGESVQGVGNAADLIKLVVAMSNDPNSDWVILCDECQSLWCYEWDFTDGSYHGWTRRISASLPDGGIFNPQGVRSARQTINTRHSIWLENHSGELIGINTLEIQYTSPYPLVALEYKKDSTVTTRTFTGWPAGTSIVKTITSEFLAGWNDAQLYLYSGLGISPTNYFYIEKIRVKGFGALPSGLSGGTECE